MQDRDVADVLAERARHAGLAVPESLSRPLTAYYRLLTHWNRKINLTSLSDPAEAVDRLLLEPVAAAAYLPPGRDLIDLGSGGGSPAVPLALALGVRRLVMVESRGRKAAFLQEVLRELGLPGSVETARYEDLPDQPSFSGRFGLVSIRAVRVDSALLEAVQALLDPGGQAALFRAVDAVSLPALPSTLTWLATHSLISASQSALTLLQKASR